MSESTEKVLRSFEEWIQENRPDGWDFQTVLEIDEEPTDTVVMEETLEHAPVEPSFPDQDQNSLDQLPSDDVPINTGRIGQLAGPDPEVTAWVDEEEPVFVGPIDLTLEQWREVKGVGPTLAQRLVENGPYHSLDDIKAIKGISGRVFEKITSSVSSASSSDEASEG